jgi:hypothetical protein
LEGTKWKFSWFSLLLLGMFWVTSLLGVGSSQFMAFAYFKIALIVNKPFCAENGSSNSTIRWSKTPTPG